MPAFALDGSDHPDYNSEGHDEDVFHGNEAEIEEEIALVDDHDGDIDASSTHSSPFRETMSPDVFRPKGIFFQLPSFYKLNEFGGSMFWVSLLVLPCYKSWCARQKKLTM